MASTAIRPLAPLLETSTWRVTRTAEALDLDVQHLTTAIKAVFGIHTVGPKGAAVSRVFCYLRSFESVGRAAVSATAFGLLAFRISHVECG